MTGPRADWPAPVITAADIARERELVAEQRPHDEPPAEDTETHRNAPPTRR
jgi:hypothetical protein